MLNNCMARFRGTRAHGIAAAPARPLKAQTTHQTRHERNTPMNRRTTDELLALLESALAADHEQFGFEPPNARPTDMAPRRSAHREAVEAKYGSRAA
jgi:hypothetical protein